MDSMTIIPIAKKGRHLIFDTKPFFVLITLADERVTFSNARNNILFKVDPRIAINSMNSFENKELNTHENVFELTQSIV